MEEQNERTSAFLTWYRTKVVGQFAITVQNFHNINKKMEDYEQTRTGK